MEPAQLRTERLFMTAWTERDAAALEAMGQDPDVMRFFPSVLSREQSSELLGRLKRSFEQRGWGMWAVRELPDGEALGFVGLAQIADDIPIDAAVEVGWRLAREAWGRGLATEAAGASLDYAFDVLALDEVVAYTAAVNEPSRRVMDRLGMRHDTAADFPFPGLADGPLRGHVVYRISAAEWRGRSA